MKNKTTNICQILFLLGLFLFEFSNFAANITLIPVNILYKLIDISMLILGIDSLFTIINLKINKKKFAIIVLFFISSFLIMLKTNNNFFLQFLLLFLASLSLDFKKVIKYDFIFKIILLIYIVLCNNIGYSGQSIFYRAGEIRYSFGFKNPNTFGFYIMILLLDFSYLCTLKSNKFLKFIYFISIILSLYYLNISGSRSSQISIILFIIISFIDKFKKFNLKNKSKLLSTIFIIFVIFSIIIAMYYGKSDVLLKLDKTLSGRISIASSFLNNYSLKIFGQPISTDISLDNAYIRLLLNYGIAGFILFYYIFKQIFKFAIKNEDRIIIFITLVLLVYGLMEWYLIRIGLNIFLLYYSCNLTKKKEKVNANEKLVS